MAQFIQSWNRKTALEILVPAFLQNPNMRWLARAEHPEHIQALCEHCIAMSMHSRGALLSDDKKGVLLWYRKSDTQNWKARCINAWLYFKLLCFNVSWKRIPQILWQQIELNAKLPKGNYLYCSVMAVSANNKNLQTTIDLRNALFEISRETGLPIYVQTSVWRNKLLFESQGFKSFDTWCHPSGKYLIWLLKREPHA